MHFGRFAGQTLENAFGQSNNLEIRTANAAPAS